MRVLIWKENNLMEFYCAYRYFKESNDLALFKLCATINKNSYKVNIVQLKFMRKLKKQVNQDLLLFSHSDSIDKIVTFITNILALDFLLDKIIYLVIY